MKSIFGRVFELDQTMNQNKMGRKRVCTFTPDILLSRVKAYHRELAVFTHERTILEENLPKKTCW